MSLCSYSRWLWRSYVIWSSWTMQAQKTGRTLMAEIWRLVVSGTVESRPQFPPTIQALVWGLNWIYGSRPRCIHFNWNIFIHTMSVSSLYIIMIFIMELIFIAFCRYESYDVKQCTHWWEAEASTVVMMPSITAKSSKGTLAVWETIPSSLCCQTNLLGFCLSFMLFSLKA